MILEQKSKLFLIFLLFKSIEILIKSDLPHWPKVIWWLDKVANKAPFQWVRELRNAFWTRWNSLCEMAFERIDSVRKNIKSVETVPQILLGINETVFWAPFTGFCSWFSSERSADCNGCRWTDSVQQKEPPRHNRLYYRSVATVRQRLNVCPDQRMPKVIWSWLNWVNCNSRDCKINFVILTVGMLKGGLWNLFIARLGKSLTWSQSARQVTAVIWP